jgi:ribose transport system substrate-binding protein
MNRKAWFGTMALMAAACVCARGGDKTDPEIALVMKALSNPFFAGMEKGAQDYAHSQSIHLDSFGVERETDVDVQIGILETLIQKGYDGIVLAPADSVRLVPAVKKAIDAGIHVVNVDNPLSKEKLAEVGISVPFVGPDNFAGARLIGEYVGAKLNGKSAGVLYVEGIRGVANADLRRDGFKAGLEGSDVAVIGSVPANWHVEEAMTATVDFLKDREGLPGAIACANDSMALGARQGVDLALSEGAAMLIAGYDNVPELRGQLRDGRIHATVEQHPGMMGAYGVDLAKKMVDGEEVPGYVATPVDLVTHETFGKKVLFAVSNAENPFFQSVIKGVRELAALHGMELSVEDAADDSAKQLETILAHIENGVDVVIVNAADTAVLGSAVELANAAGIPVITVDRNVMSGRVESYVASDNLSGGEMAAAYLLEQKPGGGRVLELQGLLGTSAAHERGTGFNAVMCERPEYAIDHQTADFDRAKARDLVLGLLEAGQRYDVVFAHNDEMILGALDAYRQAGLEDSLPILIGFDATAEAVAEVRSGNLAATIAQEPEKMGRLAVQVAADVARGIPVAGETKVKLSLVAR